MVTENGQVKLVDFGIATLLGEEDGEDVAPFSLGNAAPEQLNGETVSVQTDVFALGVLLHHLLTDRLPTRQPNGSVQAKLDNITADLGAIIEKSLQADPQSRYESVSALSQDVRAVLNHEAVNAFRGGTIYRLKKLIRRAPLASALSAGLAASLLIGMGVSQHFARTAQAEAERANAELATAQWRTDQSKLRERISNAKSQMMIYAFGQEDVDSLSEHLVTLQNRNIAEQKEKNPLHTAATSYAIGRHFVSRNDYKKAVSVLEPWVTEGYGGDAQLLSYGQVNLGHTYLALGEPEKALDMFKKSVTFYAGTPDEFSMDHAATAMEIALLSKDQETIDESLKTINTTLSQQENPYAKMYLLSKLYNMEYDRGNWDEAYKSIRESVDIIDSNATLMTQGSDTRRLKLAHMEIFHHKNLDAAQEQIDLARDVNQDLIGENLVTAKIHQYQGSMHWLRGNNDLAVSEFETSLPLIEKYEGKTDSYPKMLARLAIFYSDAGQADKARETLEEAKALSAENSSHWIPLAETYLLARSGNLKDAQDYYNNTSAKSYLENHLEAAAFLEALQKKGLQL